MLWSHGTPALSLPYAADSSHACREPPIGSVPEPNRKTSTGGCTHVARTTLRPCRHHRRGPRHGDGVLRRAGSRGRGHPDVHGGRVPGHRHRHPRLPHRDRHAAAARRRYPAGAVELRPARPRAGVTGRDGQRAGAAQRGLRGRRPPGAQSTGWPRTATGWSAASVSTSTSGAWPTCADRRGSSCPWPSGSAETRST